MAIYRPSYIPCRALAAIQIQLFVCTFPQVLDQRWHLKKQFSSNHLPPTLCVPHMGKMLLNGWIIFRTLSYNQRYIAWHDQENHHLMWPEGIKAYIKLCHEVTRSIWIKFRLTQALTPLSQSSNGGGQWRDVIPHCACIHMYLQMYIICIQEMNSSISYLYSFISNFMLSDC